MDPIDGKVFEIKVVIKKILELITKYNELGPDEYLHLLLSLDRKYGKSTYRGHGPGLISRRVRIKKLPFDDLSEDKKKRI